MKEEAKWVNQKAKWVDLSSIKTKKKTNFVWPYRLQAGNKKGSMSVHFV